MKAGHERRLAKLEQERRPAAEVLVIWWNAPQETREEAIARSFPDGVPADAEVVTVKWLLAGEAGVEDPAQA
jgi:hypothetical protein